MPFDNLHGSLIYGAIGSIAIATGYSSMYQAKEESKSMSVVYAGLVMILLGMYLLLAIFIPSCNDSDRAAIIVSFGVLVLGCCWCVSRLQRNVQERTNTYMVYQLFMSLAIVYIGFLVTKNTPGNNTALLGPMLTSVIVFALLVVLPEARQAKAADNVGYILITACLFALVYINSLKPDTVEAVAEGTFLVPPALHHIQEKISKMLSKFHHAELM